MTSARSIRVRGVVQGVGFRPFVFRLAHENTLAGWVLNAADGVEIHVEGRHDRLDTFLHDLRSAAPVAASIAEIDVAAAAVAGLAGFTIRESAGGDHPTVRIAPDLALCAECLAELFDPRDARYRYPYINCTNCGPRYSIILGLPYDRQATTMRAWSMDVLCSSEYHDPMDRRFHAQPVACPACGPRYVLRRADGTATDDDAIAAAATLLRDGGILAVKGIGGYHLACDARSDPAVAALRDRKYRKEKPFAVMVPDLRVAATIAALSPQSSALLESTARPIVLVPAVEDALPSSIAPNNDELGVMLPYAPLHYLLFAAGAPQVLVMTSGNRSSEPIAYEDEDAVERLDGIADAFLIGERPIARRVEDSVVRAGDLAPLVLRRSRGYAPGVVTTIPIDRPLLALGADLKSAITLVVEGQAFVSQHLGDLDQYDAYRAFEETVDDLLTMYRIARDDLIVVHDAHPEYRSTRYAQTFGGAHQCAVQHHRAHIASAIAERGAWDRRVLGVSFDGTGYGDDGAIWGGEIFAGKIISGFERVGHLRPANLAGGDAAARHPVQAAAGFLNQIDNLPDLAAHPFDFPSRYRVACRLIESATRTFSTTSIGRLFDTVAALLGFTRAVTFEGQAAMWVECLARGSAQVPAYDFPFDGRELDFRPLLASVVHDRLRGRPEPEIALAFHLGLARGAREATVALCGPRGIDTVVLSGGVFQNRLLATSLTTLLEADGLEVWTNHAVPPNDGGISLGQAALATFDPLTCTSSPSR